MSATKPQHDRLAALTLTALGVVYGDIGTSPLYALRECFSPQHGLSISEANVLGVLSLVFWALVVVVTVKYLVYVMRADNAGEGGILALTALAVRKLDPAAGGPIILLGLFGAALLYGDGVITPAISVLGAMEGLEVAAPGFSAYVVPLSIAVLIVFFAFQRRGTHGVGMVFGPVMLIWFSVLAILGLRAIAARPDVLRALMPTYGIDLLLQHRSQGFFLLGSIFLVVTGAEALYADMGHFGRRPIYLGWAGLVMPALVLNYFGQGALLLSNPDAARNPFYLLAPEWLLVPLLVLATGATIVASQAVVSGAFSLTSQAVQMGYLPRMRIRHTSADEAGQIYVPAVNWLLAAGTIALVPAFGSSGALAAAYGIAVSTTMVVTTLLAAKVARERWNWSRGSVATITTLFLLVDVSFLLANGHKIADGGWLPLVIGVGILLVFQTWKLGRAALARNIKSQTVPLAKLMESVGSSDIVRVSGTAVFMVSNPRGTPLVLLHHLTHNHSLHERVVLMTVRTASKPFARTANRVQVTELENGFYRVIARYGFMERPRIEEILAACRAADLDLHMEECSFFLGRETIVPTGQSGLPHWRASLFAAMSRNAQRATSFFGIPTARVVELGVQVPL